MNRYVVSVAAANDNIDPNKIELSIALLLAQTKEEAKDLGITDAKKGVFNPEKGWVDHDAVATQIDFGNRVGTFFYIQVYVAFALKRDAQGTVLDLRQTISYQITDDQEDFEVESFKLALEEKYPKSAGWWYSNICHVCIDVVPEEKYYLLN